MPTIKNLIKEATIYSFMGLLPKLLGFLLIPLITRRYTSGDNGVMDLSMTVAILLMLFLNLGLDSSISKFITPENGKQAQVEYFSTVFWFRLVIYLLALVVVMFFSARISTLLFENEQYQDVIIWALIAGLMGGLWMLFLQLYRLQLKSLSFFIMSLIRLVATLLLTLYMVIVLNGWIIAIFQANVIVDGLLIVVMIFNNHRSLFKPVFTSIGKMLKYGLPFLPAALFYYILQYVDRYFINGYMGVEQLGIYAIGVRVTVLVSMVIAGFESVWMPFLWTAYQKPNGNVLIVNVYKIFTMCLSITGLFLGIFSRELLAWLAAPQYQAATNFIYILVMALAIYYSTHYFCIGLEITGKTYHRLIGGFLAAVASVTLNIVFIPKFGIVGAAWASLIACLIYGVYVISISQKLYSMEYELSRYFAMMGLFLVFCYLATWITTISLPVFICKVLILGVVGLLTPLVLRFIDWEDLARVILSIRKMVIV
jgi:O-antigen/teichoic acid export membrane protein